LKPNYKGQEVEEMKKLVVSLCISLALITFPCLSHAQDFELTKAGSVLTTSLLGASFGILVGAVIAAASSSSSAAPILISAGIGAALGFAFAALTPSSPDTAQAEGRQDGVSPSAALQAHP